jgi:hypothetical protein
MHESDDKFIQIFVEKCERKDHEEELSVDGKIKLEWILGKWSGKVWTGFIWIWIETSGGLLWTR